MLREMVKKVLGKDAEIFRKKCQSEHAHDGFDKRFASAVHQKI